LEDDSTEEVFVSTTVPAGRDLIERSFRSEEGGTPSGWFEALARAGFIARGVIYVLIGVLALELAFGSGGARADQKGALETIARQPFGKVLLILVAVGLAGYSLWRLVHALLGRGPERSDSAFERAAASASGVVYAGMCAIAVAILVGAGGSAGNAKQATAGVLGWPGGTWLVGAAGIALLGVACYQAYRGLSRDFLKDSKTEEMGPRVRSWVKWIGTFGHLARAVVFGLVGVFLVKAAVEYDPNAAVGLDGALAKLTHNSYGPFLLAVVAAGLMAFGVYSLSDARYRRI
jgi:fumarate reductase subunit D